ncbi:hypothetical protein [Rhodoferax sp. U11-2br]|uniref:hypothetical protein n=1 Tax=Rhodoferax sp. U11-2br TaxID=2838878 RepID=UPI001BE87B09|nr:hypothetical protein [Rhodoferax sp. U11-2br]MBT3067854.1 hypothetical protein [Rhodoferax sp. U11-2br]
MQYFQDTETGQIHAFDDGIDPFTLGYRSIPKTLSASVKPQPSEEYVWMNGDWVHKTQVPSNYVPPVSSVPSYDPAWHAFLQPYTLVLKDEEQFGVSLEQINANSYPGEMLSEPVNSLAPLGVAALISRDGAFALPMQGDFLQQHRAAEMLNRLFCALLIGGIHAEFVAHNEVLVGSLGEDLRLFIYTPTQQGRFRHMDASISERVALVHPRVIRVSKLQEALAFGLDALSRIENLSPAFLLHGYTTLQHQNASEALSSLWIVVEQLTSFLWEKRFLDDPKLHPVNMKGRLQGMRQDNRTWTTSVKHELLWQSKVLPENSYASLSIARSQRNRLVHEGRVPDIDSVTSLWPALCTMLEVASGVSMAKLSGMGVWSHQPSTRVKKTNFENWDSLVKQFV